MSRHTTTRCPKCMKPVDELRVTGTGVNPERPAERILFDKQSTYYTEDPGTELYVFGLIHGTCDRVTQITFMREGPRGHGPFLSAHHRTCKRGYTPADS